MLDPFVQKEWQRLCEHLGKCANAIARDDNEQERFRAETQSFSEQAAPVTYRDLLARTAEAAKLAITWQRIRDEDLVHENALVDEAGMESFPASDPPAFSHSHA